MPHQLAKQERLYWGDKKEVIGGRTKAAFRKGISCSKEEIGDFLKFAVLQSEISAKKILANHYCGLGLVMDLKLWAGKELLLRQQ